MGFYIHYFWQLIKSGFSVASKVIVVMAILIAVVNIFARSIYPDKGFDKDRTNTISKQRDKMYFMVNNPQNNNTPAQKNIMAGMRIITCVFIGETCDPDPNSPNNNYKKSLIGRLSEAIALPFLNPPASGIYAINQTLSNFALIPKSYAATGIGFASLSPLFSVWKALRDVALMIVVLVVIVIGFLIMFRMKLNPQTVISIENSLPKIILSMILITFSFAIVGFLIDFMYVLMALVITILGPLANLPTDLLVSKFLLAGPDDIFSIFSDPTNTGKWFGDILFSLPFAIMHAIPIVGDAVQIGGTILGFWRVFPALFNLTNESLFETFNIDFSLPVVGGVTADGPIKAIATRLLWGAILLPLSFSLASFIIPFLIGLIILLTVISLFFRLLMMIFRSYIIILFLTVLAPLILLLEAIPGHTSFTDWFRTLISELFTFPALVAILLIGLIITDATNGGFLTQFPFLHGVNGNALSLIVGMMLMFMIPDLIKKIKQKIQPKPVMLESAGIGAFVSGGAAGIGAVGGFQKIQSLFLYRNGNPLLPTALQGLLPRTKAQENEDLAKALGKVINPQGTPPAAGNCLPPSTLITTKTGQLPIFKLRAGDMVITIDSNGNENLAPIIRTSKTKVSKHHKMSHITLSDGRDLFASLTHPLTTGKSIQTLKAGSMYDGVTVVKNSIVSYHRKYTYDILVDGETGFYIANKIPLASTLK